MSRPALPLDQLLEALARKGVHLYAEDGRLKFRAPAGAMDEDLKADLRLYRPQILEMLSASDVAAEGDTPALTYAQERLWFLQQMDPPSGAYNLQALFRLEGAVDTGLLQRSLDRIAARHEILRTRFVDRGEGVEAVVEEKARFPLHADDLPAGAEHPDRAARDKAAEDARRPFDLGQAPPLRARLMRSGEDRSYLLLTMHHIITDGWSHALFFEEFAAVYGALEEGREPRLDPLPMQFGEHARRQRRRMSGERLRGELQRAVARLEGAPQLLDLPRDYPRPPTPTHRGTLIAHTLDARETAAFRDLCERHGASLYMGLFALFQLWLSRLSGQEDLLAGTPVAGRTDSAAESLIGFFVNTAVVRARVKPGMSFADLLDRTREELLDTLQQQEIPFEKIVEELNPPRIPGGNPLFQVFFNMLNHERREASLPGLRVTQLDLPETATPFDLTLYATEEDRELRLELLFARDLFSGDRGREMLAQIVHLFRQVAEDAGRTAGDYSLLTPEARERFSAPLPGTPAGDPLPLTRRVAGHMKMAPEAPALRCGETALDYGTLHARAHEVARMLTDAGIRRPALLSARGAELPVAVLAALSAGLPFLILDASHPGLRHRRLMELAGADGLLACGDAQPSKELGNFLGERAIPLHTFRLDNFKNVHDAGAPTTWMRPAPADRPAWFAATSGTTGESRLVAGGRGALDRFVEEYLEAWDVTTGERFAMLSGLSHDPLLRDVLVPFAAGASLAVPSPALFERPHALWTWLRGEEVTCLHLTPALMQLLLDAAEEDGLDPLPGVTRIIFGGEALTRTLLRRAARAFPRARLFNGYGTTETPQLASYHEVTADGRSGGEGTRLLPVGRGMGSSLLRVLGHDGAEAGVGEAGEVAVQSHRLSLGYWSQGEQSDAHLLCSGDGAPLYRTGDRGRRLPGGEVVVEGRLDRRSNLHGYLVDPLEIERCMEAFPGVSRGLAWIDGERLLGAWTPLDGQTFSCEALLAHLRRHLPAHMVPSAMAEVDEIPLTPNGKTDYRKLAGQVSGAGPSADRPYRAPGTPTEELLCGIWGELTGRERVGVDDDFFRIGGHSLLAARATNRIRSALGVDLPLRDHFTHPTVRELAASLDRARASGVSRGVTGEAPAAESTVDLLPLLPSASRGPYPLSHAQRRIWVLQRMDPGALPYSMPRSLRMEGELQAGWIAQILRELAARHEVLRTVIEVRGGEPVQVVREEMGPLFRYVDLTGSAAPLEEAARMAEEDAAAPFDLEEGPLLRCALLKTGPLEHVLLFNMHHIISDGWSMRLVEEAFGEGLRRRLADETPAIAPASPARELQYGDYALWQRRFLSTPAAAALREAWKEELTGELPVLDLPADAPRPPVKTYNGDRQAMELDSDCRRAVAGLAAGHACTPYMVLNALSTALLHRYSGSEDFIVGTPSAGRYRTELEDRVGCFVNMLPLRVRPTGDTPFADYLRQVGRTVTSAFAREAYPYDRLVDELEAGRRPERSPLFDVAVVYQDPDIRTLEVPGLAIEPFVRPAGTAKYDLSLTFEASEEELRLEIEYNTDLFSAERIRGIFGHFQNLALSAAGDPGRALGDLALMDEGEEAQVRARSAGPAAGGSDGALLHELFAAQAERRPRKTALACGDRTLSYGELHLRSDRVADALREGGLQPGDRVVLETPRSENTVVAMLGILKAGGAYVPVDPDYPEQRNDFIMRDCGAACRLDARMLDTLEEGIPAEAFAPGAGRVAEPAGAEEEGDGRCAYVIYTSGSTGRPKGCRVSHRNVARLMLDGAQPFGFGAADTWISTHSFCFDFSVWEMYGALLYGGKLVIADREASRNPEMLHGLLRRHGVTVLNQTPAAFCNLSAVDAAAPESRKADRLRYVIFGGDRLDLAQLEPWIARHDPAACRLVNMYGITETTVHVTAAFLTAGDIRGARGESLIGRPLSGVELYVMDPRMRPCPPGVPGELCVGGSGVSGGYLNRPELTEEKFVPHPWAEDRTLYRSGDLGRMRFDGTFEYLGRRDNQVQMRGFRIECGEVEAVLSAHPGVARAVVLLQGEEESRKKLVAWFVPAVRAGAAPPASGELRNWAGRSMPGYMVPADFHPVEEIPLTDNGKIDRGALLERAAPEADNGVQAAEGSHPAEELIARIWAEVLQAPDPDRRTNFFDLGGNSLALMKVHARLQEHLSAPLPVVDLFRHTTVRELARHLEQNDILGPSAAVHPTNDRHDEARNRT